MLSLVKPGMHNIFGCRGRHGLDIVADAADGDGVLVTVPPEQDEPGGRDDGRPVREGRRRPRDRSGRGGVRRGRSVSAEAAGQVDVENIEVELAHLVQELGGLRVAHGCRASPPPNFPLWDPRGVWGPGFRGCHGSTDPDKSPYRPSSRADSAASGPGIPPPLQTAQNRLYELCRFPGF